MKSYINITFENNKLCLYGNWTLSGIEKLPKNPLKHLVLPTYPLKIDGSSIKSLDSAGVYTIEKIKRQLENANITIEYVGFSQQQKTLIEIIHNAETQTHFKSTLIKYTPIEKLGKEVVAKFKEFMLWMNFIGEFSITTIKLLAKPWLIPWKSIIATIDFMGIRALPIIAVLSFLIGVVLTYQIGVQLTQYGANIYIVAFLGISILREFGPLLASIILAGRTSSAYTAQLGLMKANEEIDALKTMGFSPLELLIFPRIVGLIIAMPLLTVWSDIFGLLGGMFMSKASLGVSMETFIQQFPQNVTLSSFMIGIGKAPVFALIIAAVGCYHGLKVAGSATSIGENTTKSVVLAIFLIIIADAIFSVIFSYLGI